MFTEKILQTVKNPVVFAEQKMTVPTERLVRVLKTAEVLGLNLINLTYLGAPFVDPKRGDFDLLKPRILTPSGLIRPTVSKDKSGEVGSLRTKTDQSLAEFYKQLCGTRATDFRLSLEQIAWLTNPQEFDMTDFYLEASGIDSPTRSSIVEKYLPKYYAQLGDSQIPVVTDYDRLALISQQLIDRFGVQIIDLPDFDPNLNCPTPQDFSQRSYIDLSMSEQNPLNLK